MTNSVENQFRTWRERTREANRRLSEAEAELEKPWISEDKSFGERYRIWTREYPKYVQKVDELKKKIREEVKAEIK